MITVEHTIKSKAILSDCKNYRYLLKKEWHKDKKGAVVLMLNPSKADSLKLDKTVMNVMNYLIEKDYGSMTIVNLYAYMTTYPKELKNRDKSMEKANDEFIKNAASQGDTVIVAWTKNDHINRKRDVEKLLMPYRTKLKCFQDESGKKPRHPRDLSFKWTLVDYEFMK